MQISGIHHHSVVVANTDMEDAVRFYKEVLQLQEIGIPATFPPAGVGRVRWFKVGNQHIHLMPRETGDVISPRHLALEIDSADAARTYMTAKGIPFREDVPIPGADRIIISDPAGNNIELIEWKETYQIVEID